MIAVAPFCVEVVCCPCGFSLGTLASFQSPAVSSDFKLSVVVHYLLPGDWTRVEPASCLMAAGIASKPQREKEAILKESLTGFGF